MNDLISRQAAIDAVSDCGICIQRIVELPSAQPEIIRCKECKKWNVYGNRGEGWCDEWKEMLMDICFCSSAKRREDNP